MLQTVIDFPTDIKTIQPVDNELVTKAYDAAQQLVVQVQTNTRFGELNYGTSPMENFKEVSQAITEIVIRPVICAVATFNPKVNVEAHINKAYDLLVPKSYGFAQQVINEYRIPVRSAPKMGEVASFVYLVDALVDNTDSSEQKRAMLGIVEPFGRNPDERHDVPDFLGIDRMIAGLGVRPGSREDTLLRNVIINDALTVPQKFELGIPLEGTANTVHLANLTEAERIMRIKVDGSGYDIAFWTATFLLKKHGLIEQSPIDIMARNPELDKARKIGAMLTRQTDDMGDAEEDRSRRVINITTAENRDEIYMAAFEYCGIDAERYDGNLTEMEIVDILVEEMNAALDKFNQRKDSEAFAGGEGKSADEHHITQILRKCAVITYENYIGDSAQYASYAKAA